MNLIPTTTKAWLQRSYPPKNAARETAMIAGAAGVAVVIGAGVAGGLPISRAVVLALVGAGLLLLVASSTLLRRWRLALGVFLAWLVVEDLVRKLTGNDIRMYFVKDLIYLLLLISLFINPDNRGAWRSAMGHARLPLYAMMGWAVVMAIPVAVADWQLAVVGLRLDFLYVPLVVAGFLLATGGRDLSRALLMMSLLGAVASSVGILQAIIGPEFLSPGRATPGLIHLVLIRAQGTVYRPTGTFVDPGRFDSMAVIAVAIGIAAMFVNRGRRRSLAAACMLASFAAVWVSGGRSGLLQGVALLVVALVPMLLRLRRATLVTLVLVAFGSVAGIAAISYFFPTLLSNPFAFYLSTLNPFSSENEWAFRWNQFTTNLQRGIDLGGLIGLGTGHESLGKQYLYGGPTNSVKGLYLIEGGYAAVAVEFGLVGLVIWLVWSIAWTRRQLRLAWTERDRALRSASLVLAAYLVIFSIIEFAIGFQTFQNYLANAYFWLLSGVVFGIHRASQPVVTVHNSNLPAVEPSQLRGISRS